MCLGILQTMFKKMFKYLGGSNRSSENRLSDKVNSPPQQSRPPGECLYGVVGIVYSVPRGWQLIAC